MMFSQTRDILIVEDHADTADVIARALESRGHRLLIAATCADARRMFAANLPIDLLLIDIGLPDGDGCDLLLELAAIRRVPAIAVTGYGMDHEIDRCKQSGFIAHIMKPVVLPKLFELLASIPEPGNGNGNPNPNPAGSDSLLHEFRHRVKQMTPEQLVELASLLRSESTRIREEIQVVMEEMALNETEDKARQRSAVTKTREQTSPKSAARDGN